MDELIAKRQQQADSNMVYASDKQLGARYGVHRTAIWRWAKNGGFPSPIRLSPGCTRWKMSDVIAHEQRVA